MEIKVLYDKPVVEIEGVKYRYHKDGGGMVAETAEVAETAYIGPFAKICGNTKILDNALCLW